MIRRCAGLLLILWATAGAAGESLDSLFDSVNSDTIVTKPGSDSVDALNRPVFLYFGSVETQSVVAAGWNDTHRDYPVSSVYYFLHFQGGVDVQPIPQARLIGTFSTYLPQNIDSAIIDNIRNGTTQTGTATSTTTEVNTSQTLALDELFLDYTIYDSAFFRVGKFAQTWGLGHLFNPGNLVSATGDGINFKGFASTGPFAFTGLVIANPKFFADEKHPRADELGYAGSLGITEGIFTGSFSAYKQRASGTQLDGGIKTSLFGLDLYSEILGYQNPSDDKWWPGLLVGAYVQLKTEWPWRLLAEYWLDGSLYTTPSRNIGIGASSLPYVKNLDLRLSAKWYHSIDDGSGQLVTGFDITPLPKLNIAIGIPWTYGSKTGRYVVGNTDPEQRSLAAFLTIGVKFDFEKAR